MAEHKNNNPTLYICRVISH